MFLQLRFMFVHFSACPIHASERSDPAPITSIRLSVLPEAHIYATCRLERWRWFSVPTTIDSAPYRECPEGDAEAVVKMMLKILSGLW